MRSTEKQELSLKIKRLGLFMVIVFLPILVICVLLLVVAKVPQWLNILVLVLCMFVLYGVYVFVCAKLDRKKAERLTKKKDPFAE